MTPSLAEFTNTSRRLSAWLGVWRILIVIFSVLGVLSFIGGFFLFSASASEPGTNAGPIGLLPLLFIPLIALMAWIYTMLLGQGKDWVDGATSAVERGQPTQLRTIQGTLDKWLSFFIWGMLAYIVIVPLILLGMSFTLGIVFGDITGALFGSLGLVFFLVMIASFLIGTYFPYTALRQFLARATARLGGSPVAVTPSANNLRTWMWVLIALQLLSLLSNLFTPMIGGSDSASAGLLIAFVTLPLTLGLSLLYLIPMWLVGKFATLLGELLDRQRPDSAPTGPLPDNLSIGRIADSFDHTQQR
ncbi:MAG: hypothetical protein Q4C89_06385 [Deinococcus sp.]|uniref:hypothetical protein n=1 Tax=Deinococcus sp. TaxID=47478 RepID=UPI0026DD033B|nr:hypothetical protein [Deinococcus sp.]MDO4245631.1 hypothetical protein [Deinococcus sp.]